MSSRLSPLLLTMIIGVLLGAAGIFTAPAAAAPPLAQEILGVSELRLDTQASWERAAVQVKGPQGLRIRQDFAPGEAITVSLVSEEGGMPADGRYTYMLKVEPAAGPGIQTGMFFVEGGELVSRAAKRAELQGIRQDLNGERQARMTPAPQAIPPDPTSYSVDDILRILDTAGDYETRASLYSSGNSIWDIYNSYGDFEVRNYDQGTTPFYLDEYANSLSLIIGYDALGTFNDTSVIGDFGAGNGFFNPPLFFVDDYNDFVGVNTGSPANLLHVYNGSLRVERGDGVTPNIRFSSIDAGQRWLFQNNASSGVFAIRDETAGASPFRIKPGAPENGLTIETNGRLSTSTGAFLSPAGVWTNASSRELKEDIQDLSVEEALAVLRELDPVKFKYRGVDERHVGFIAEDVPELVASAERRGLSAMDVVAVLTRVVQEQQGELTAKSDTVDSLREEVAVMSRRLEELEALLAQRQDGQ